MPQIKWEKSLSKKDIKASSDFLSLLFNANELERMISKLKKHKKDVQKFKAKDILRASKLEVLPETNEDVRAEFQKVVDGERFVPISLVRCTGQLYIADGYHRTCAAYYLNNESDVHCVLVGAD